jgi:hypothetical protein
MDTMPTLKSPPKASNQTGSPIVVTEFRVIPGPRTAGQDAALSKFWAGVLARKSVD